MRQTSSITIDSSSDRSKVLEYAEIDAPGAYVIRGIGLLLRVPPEGLVKGRSPIIELCGRKAVKVHRISEDPWIGLNRARGIAANHDLPVMF